MNWHRKNTRRQKYDGYYVTKKQNRFIRKEVINLYSKQDKLSQFQDIKRQIISRPMYLSTWNHIVGYICLCFISLVFLNYIIYILNSKLGLTGKSKITDIKWLMLSKKLKKLKYLK